MQAYHAVGTTGVFDGHGVSEETYRSYQIAQPAKRDTGGGSFYNTLSIRNSKKLSNTVTKLVASGSLSFIEAGRLLQISPIHVLKIN